MSDIDDLMTGSGGPPVDFNGVGSTVEGTLNSIGDKWLTITTPYGPKLKKPFNLTIENEARTLWVQQGSRLATVIGSAFKEAGLSSIVTGGVLKVQRTADVDVGKGNPMHDYRARYTPAAMSTSELADEEPF